MSLLVGETAVSVKLRDDGFQRQLVSMVDAAVRAANSSLERLGDSMRPVNVTLDDAQVRAFVESMARPIDTSILPTVDDMQAKAELDDLGKFIQPVIQPFVDGEKARGEIGDLTKAWEATMTVIVDDAAARAARSDLERPIEPTFQPQPSGGGAAQAAEKGGESGGMMGKVGGLALAGPEALAAGLTVATLVGLTKAGADYQSVLKQIETAATMLPEDAIRNEAALAKLRPTVTALGNDLELPGQSAKDAAEAINVLVRANYPLAEAEALARNALQLSIVTKEDAAASTTMLTDVMASSGLAANDATFAMDRLAMAELLGKGKVADLAESVKYAGTGFKAIYGDTLTARDGFEQMLGTLLTLDQAGVRGSLAGTMLNRMLTDLATPTGKAQTQLDELTKRLNTMNPAFLKGGSVTRDFEGNVRPIPEIIRNLSIATADMTTAQKDAAIQTALGGKAFEGLTKEQRDAALATVFTTNGLRAFQAMQGQAADSTDKFVGKLHEADGAAKKAAEGSASDLSKAIENFGSTLSTVSNDIVDKLSPAITTGLTATTNGIAAAGKAVLTEMEPGKFQGHMEQVGQTIANVIGPDTLAKIQGYLGQIGPTFQSGFDAVKSIVETVVNIISDLWDRFGQTLLNGLKGAIDSMITIASGFMTLLKGVFDTISAVLHGDWEGLWNGLKEIVRGAWQVIVGLVDGAWNVIKTAFGVALGLLSAAWSAGWHALHTLLVDVWDGIKKAVTNGIDAVVGFLKTLPGKAVSAVGNVASTLLSAGKDLLEGFKKGAEEIWRTVSSWLGTLAKLAVSAVGSLGSSLLSVGKGLIQGLWDGAEAVWKGFYSWLKSLPGKVTDAIGSIPGKIGGALNHVGIGPVHLAVGGLVSSPTYALIGEAGPEVVLPLTNPTRMREILADSNVQSMLASALGPAAGALGAQTTTDGALTVNFDTGWVTKLVDALVKLTEAITAMTAKLTNQVGASVGALVHQVGRSFDETQATMVASAHGFAKSFDETQQTIARVVGKSFDETQQAFGDGGLVTSATRALIGEAGPEAILPLGKPEKMRRILSDRMVASAILGAMPATDRSLLGEVRRMRGTIAELQASHTTVVVPDPAMLHIYARAQADATTRRLRRGG